MGALHLSPLQTVLGFVDTGNHARRGSHTLSKLPRAAGADFLL
jgi:hypothetical protein